MKPRLRIISARRCRSAASWLIIATACLTPARAADESLARHVPAQIGFFAELRRGEDLLLPLIDPQAWLTVAALAGQPAGPADTQQWQQRVHQTLNMSPEEVIRVLFAQRVAFAGERLQRAEDAAILCTPAVEPRALVRNWPVQPLPTAGRTSVYRLPNNIGLAVHDTLLVFGDDTNQGIFAGVLRGLETGKLPSLADDPVYQRLLARLPQNPDGLFFARLREAPLPSTSAPATASAPASAPGSAVRGTGATARQIDLPGPLRGSANVLLALHRDGRLLHFSAVGDAPAEPQPRDGNLHDLLAGLPARTLLAWAGYLDFPLLTQAVETLPERNLFRLAFQLQERTGSFQRLTDSLNASVCIAVGVVQPETRRLTAPPVPAVAVLLPARDPVTAGMEWSAFFDATLAVYKLLALKGGTPSHPLQLDELTLAGQPAERLDLTPLFTATPEQNPFGEVHLCWAMDDDVLILASHCDWLQQILAARNGAAPTLSGVLELTRRPPTGQRDNIFVAQTGPIADLGALWLHYLEQTSPVVLHEDWWRAYQPGGRTVRLGIQATEDAPRRRLRVQSVTPGAPAAGVLRVGDEIVGANHRRFATSQPVQEMTRGIVERPEARWIYLLVERDHVVREKRVPLPFVDPVQVLRRVISVGKILQRVVYADDAPDPSGPRGFLTLELRADAPPLFPFEMLTPASAPATAPAPSTAPTTPSPTTAPAPSPATTPAATSPAPATQPASAPTPAPAAPPEPASAPTPVPQPTPVPTPAAPPTAPAATASAPTTQATPPPPAPQPASPPPLPPPASQPAPTPQPAPPPVSQPAPAQPVPAPTPQPAPQPPAPAPPSQPAPAPQPPAPQPAPTPQP